VNLLEIRVEGREFIGGRLFSQHFGIADNLIQGGAHLMIEKVWIRAISGCFCRIEEIINHREQLPPGRMDSLEVR